MSGLHNPAPITFVGESTGIRGEYPDPNGNLWLIEVSGQPEQVAYFVENKPFRLKATQLSEEEAGKLREKLSEKLERQSEGQNDSEDQIPALHVTFTLSEQNNIKAPYRVQFELDPPMNREHKSEKYDFSLWGNDTTANVEYWAEKGTVSIKVAVPDGRFKWSGPGSHGEAAVQSVSTNSDCSVTVYWKSGEPEYRLGLDKIVF